MCLCLSFSIYRSLSSSVVILRVSGCFFNFKASNFMQVGFYNKITDSHLRFFLFVI